MRANRATVKRFPNGCEKSERVMNPDPKADETVRRLLGYLEPRIDLKHVAQVSARHQAALRYERVDRPPLVCYAPYEAESFTPYPFPEAFTDPAKMMLNELLIGFTSIYHAVDLKDDSPYTLRPNLGVGIVASMFGAEIRLVGNEMPWVMPLNGGLKGLRRALLDAPLPDINTGLIPRALDQYGYFKKVLEEYPSCRAGLQIILPDLEGPFSTLELLWGTGIYEAVCDIPEEITALLDRVTEAMLVAYERLKPEVRDNIGPDCHYCHAMGVKGRYLVRDDSAINISPEQYRQILKPFDTRLAAAIGSVGIHFCGNGQHQVDNFLDIPGVDCLDLGQPEKMNLDSLYQRASDHNVPLVRLAVPEPEFTADQVIKRFPSGVTLVYQPKTLAQARDFVRRYDRVRFQRNDN